MVRKSKGRQKIEMVKMKNESNLQVTFSKRRSGLFKKASELCTLCGADIAIVVFSPGRKVYSFGHPNVETVINRFLNLNQNHIQQHEMQLSENRRSAAVREYNNRLTQVLSQLEEEKAKHIKLKNLKKDKNPQHWWEGPVEEFNLTQLTEFKSGLENLQKVVSMKASKCLQATPLPHQHNFYTGASSSTNNNITFDLDLFNHRRMVQNTNYNMIVPSNNYTQIVENNSNNDHDITTQGQNRFFHEDGFDNVRTDTVQGFVRTDTVQGFAQDYNNMNHTSLYNSENHQSLGFKQENVSEYDYLNHLDHHRRDY